MNSNFLESSYSIVTYIWPRLLVVSVHFKPKKQRIIYKKETNLYIKINFKKIYLCPKYLIKKVFNYHFQLSALWYLNRVY